MRARFRARIVALLFLGCSPLFSQALPTEQDRLLSIAKLWTTIEYFHPYLAYRKIDWDGALVQQLPALRNAKSTAEYAQSLNSLLGQLHDPDTYIQAPGSQRQSNKTSADGGERIWVHYGADSVFLTRPPGQVNTVLLPMGAGVTASLRLSEPLQKSSPQIPTPQPEQAYQDMEYPKVEYRILSAFKLWGAIKNFFAYKDLMDQDWDQAFAGFLPKFIDAKDAREYNLAIAEAVTLLDDSNATVKSSSLDTYFGVAPIGLRTRLVEKKPLVTEVLDEDARKAGVEVGDVITKVEGEDVVARIHRLIAYISASTDQSLAAEVMQRVFNGPEGSTVTLALEGRNAVPKSVSLKRSTTFETALSVQRNGDVSKFLSKAIGYVDLDRLSTDRIDSVLDKFQATTVLILDARGAIHFEPERLSSRMIEKRETATAIVTGPINLVPDLPSSRFLTQTASFFRVETVAPSEKPHYKGKTVLLIDERTVGSAERLGLQLETANGTVFVGSLSAGAVSDINTLVLPGGITVTYSGTDVRHSNGGKLQRIGLQPTETVAPTVTAIRNGRDEPLQKAMDIIVR